MNALPSLDLLAEPAATAADTCITALGKKAGKLQGILKEFGVRGDVTAAHPGPVVTLYEFEPAAGVRSAKVIGLTSDIARSMSAVSARVAVVPGDNVIGIELPNAKRETVYLREILEAAQDTDAERELTLCLGKDISGKPVFEDLATMPHLLVAGTTGSGKSVAINAMILSLLFRHGPDECRMIMIDPKMLELSVYNGIPHLLAPVVTDAKKAVTALQWAVSEMETRYAKMAAAGVRNIKSFNAKVDERRKRLPYLVIIVDEMADLMMLAGAEIEEAIQRLAQMARAAGIHLIMATQRPSVDVITGTIKANFPTRISFQVPSRIDSRTILGDMGAEQLLGRGDMLLMRGGGALTRVHGPFCTDAEVDSVVEYLKQQGQPAYVEAVTEDAVSPFFHADENGLYHRAKTLVLRDGKAAATYVQLRLGIGLDQAKTIMRRMEDEGLIGPANHAGKHEILTQEENA